MPKNDPGNRQQQGAPPGGVEPEEQGADEEECREHLASVAAEGWNGSVRFPPGSLSRRPAKRWTATGSARRYVGPGVLARAQYSDEPAGYIRLVEGLDRVADPLKLPLLGRRDARRENSTADGDLSTGNVAPHHRKRLERLDDW